MARGSRKTFKRAKFLSKLASNFSELIDNVVIPKEINGKSLGETSEQLTKAMETINQEKTKWFRALAPYFILSRRRFDVSFKRAEDPYRHFVSFLSEDYEKVKNIENVPAKIEDLQNIISEVNDYKKNKQARSEKIVDLENKILETKQQLQELQNKGDLVEFNQINSKIIELTKSVERELRYIQKPMLKFQTLVNNPGYNLVGDANSKLEQYMTNPFEALATEKEGYPLLLTILQKINSALDNKKIKLKSSRLHKAKFKIAEIQSKPILLSLQKDCIETLNKKNELLTSGTINEVKTQRVELNDCLEQLETKKKLLEVKDARFTKEYNEENTRLEKQKIMLEEIVSNLSDTDVHILIN